MLPLGRKFPFLRKFQPSEGNQKEIEFRRKKNYFTICTKHCELFTRNFRAILTNVRITLLAHGGRKLEGNFEILGRKFKEIMSKLEGNFICQSGSTGVQVWCEKTAKA